MVKLGVVPVQQRSVQGPSFTIYNFNPWCLVEERDVDAMLKIMTKQGCGCNGTQVEIPLFAKEEDILSGKIVPVWAGQFGSPVKKSG